MKRLLDEPTSPLEEHAASLLREVGPLEPSDIARARVRRALERRPVRSRAGGFRRLAVVIFLGAGASAAAVWGGAQSSSRVRFARLGRGQSPSRGRVRRPARAGTGRGRRGGRSCRAS